MPIYEFQCNRCSHVSEIYCRQYGAPTRPPCEACGSRETVKLISLCSHKVSAKRAYGEDFVEKSMPFLKSRRELKGVFESNSGESDEAKAMKVSEQIGKGIDRALSRQFSKTKK